MNYLPFVIFLIVILALFFLMSRNRRRQAAGQQAQAERIGIGTEVMTTSGLYGTVVATNDDRTVQLSIAPGIEVRWELAALRDLASLPPHVGGARPVAEQPVDDQIDGVGADPASPSPYDPPKGMFDKQPDERPEEQPEGRPETGSEDGTTRP